MDNTDAEKGLDIRSALENFKILTQKRRLVDSHARILFAECDSSSDRLRNLLEQWENKAREGLLPKVRQIGIFEYLSKILDNQPYRGNIRGYGFRQKLETYFNRQILEGERYQTPIRNFQNILELTDLLGVIHELLAITERSYWQRLEGHEIPVADAYPSPSIAETGAIQQIYNAADFLCWDYRDKIKHRRMQHWKGLAVFGLFHEFRMLGHFVCFPAYAKLQNLRMWIYTSHEISHQALVDNSDDRDLQAIKSDLMTILAANAPLLVEYYATPDHVATELMADVLATLIAGEEYALTLAELKYYPTITFFERKPLITRQIQVPVLLRMLVCCWTALVSWGFETAGEGQVILGLLRSFVQKVIMEDGLAKRRIRVLKKKDQNELTQIIPDGQDPEEMRGDIGLVLKHLSQLESECTNVMASLFGMQIIPRLKSFVLNDFYQTRPNHFFYEASVAKLGKEKRLMKTLTWLDTRCFKRSRYVSATTKSIMKKRNALKVIEDKLRRFQFVNSDPRDIIAALAAITRKQSAHVTKYDHVAFLSIGSNMRIRNRRFSKEK